MTDTREQRQVIEDTGAHYNDIILREDIIPNNVYHYQIGVRDRILHRTIGERRFRCVLDLGCGTGFHQTTLSQYADFLIGADMSLGALKECKRKFSGEYIVCDINNLPFKAGSVDCVWIAGVLHHVPDNLPATIGNNICRILKRGGIILIDEPNKFNPLTHLVLRLSKADPTGDERPLSAGFISKILKQSDMKIISVGFYGLLAPFGLLAGNRYLFRLCESMDRSLGKIFLKIFLLRWTIYAMKE